MLLRNRARRKPPPLLFDASELGGVPLIESKAKRPEANNEGRGEVEGEADGAGEFKRSTTNSPSCEGEMEKP